MPSEKRVSVASVWPYALILAVGLLVLLPRLGDFGFWDPWEPKYAQSVREMLDRGSYVVPYYRDEARMAKPILTYWSIMAGSALFGLNEFGARIGGVSTALVSLLALYYAVSRLRGRRAALLAALILATLPQFYFLARQATPDVFLFCGIGLSLLFLCIGLFGPDERRKIHLAVSYACFAVAMLGKGPVVAGSVFFGTLTLFIASRLDWRWFWQPQMRRETTTLVLALVPGLSAAVMLGSLAFLFGTSPNVWGWSTDVHERLLGIRERIALVDARLHLTEVLLLLTLVATVFAALHFFQRHRASVKPSLMIPAVTLPPILVVIAAGIGLAHDDPAVGLWVGLSLSTLTILGLVATSCRRFVCAPPVWSVVGKRVGFVGNQVLVFLGLVLAIAGPWYLTALLRKSSLFVNDFILYNHLTRATSTINSTGAFEFYWHALAYGFFPWSCLLPIALGLVVAARGRNPTRQAGLETYLFLATMVTLVAFSTSVTKFTHYLAPALLPVATLLGITLDRLLRSRSRTLVRLAWATALIGYVVMAKDLLVPFGSKYLIGAYTVKRGVPESVAPGAVFTAILAVLAVILLASMFFRSRFLVGSLIAAAVVFSVYGAAYFTPRLSPHKTMKHLCETWIQQRGDADRIGFHGVVKHGIYYYCDAEIAWLESSAFLRFMGSESPAFSIVERSKLRWLAPKYRKAHPERLLRIVDDSHFRYVLVTNSELP